MGYFEDWPCQNFGSGGTEFYEHYPPSADLFRSHVLTSYTDPLALDFEAGDSNFMDHDHVPMHEDRDAELNHKSSMTGPYPGNGKKSTNTEPVAKVVERLFVLLEDPTMVHLIKWTTDGKYFIVVDEQGLMDIAGFKTKKFESLHKQLNNYGFHKKKKSRKTAKGELANGAWYHERFQRGRRDLLREVGRSEPITSAGPVEGRGPAPSQDGTKPLGASPFPNSYVLRETCGMAVCACEGKVGGLSQEVTSLRQEIASLRKLVHLLLDRLGYGQPDVQATHPSQPAAQFVNQSPQSSSNVSPQHTHTKSQRGSSRLEQAPSSSFPSANNGSYYPSDISHNPHHTSHQYPFQNPQIPLSACQTPSTPSPDGRSPSKRKRHAGPVPRSNPSTSQLCPNRAEPSTTSQPSSLASEPSLHVRRTVDQVVWPNPSCNDSAGSVDPSRSHLSMLSQPLSYLQFPSRDIDHWAGSMAQVPRPDKPPGSGTGGSAR
ncbi:stress-responsive transcription factor hsf1 [Tulasnella sp. JGI-2019a]|nr:stress-responsive transcription factor hsf1 [Tulasnella sp. JGI-2019a]